MPPIKNKIKKTYFRVLISLTKGISHKSTLFLPSAFGFLLKLEKQNKKKC